MTDSTPIPVCDGNREFLGSSAGFQHLVQNTLQRIVLQSCGNSLLIAQLLVHLIILVMTVLLAGYVNSVVGRQCLLKSYPHSKADDRGQRTMCDCGRDFNGHLDDGIGIRNTQGRRRSDVNVRQVDDRQLTEGNGVLWIRDC